MYQHIGAGYQFNGVLCLAGYGADILDFNLNRYASIGLDIGVIRTYQIAVCLIGGGCFEVASPLSLGSLLTKSR